MFNTVSFFIGYILDLIFSDPYSFPHPVKFMGKLINLLEKIFFKSKINKIISGFFTFFILTSISYIITFFLIKISYNYNKYLGITLESIIIYTILSAKCLEDEAKKIYKVLKTKDIEKSRKKLSYIVGRDTKNLSFEEIIKATIETVAENTVDGVLTPIFFLLIGGVPLAMGFKAVSTLDSMIGYRNERYELFGKISAKADDVCNFIPARISFIFFVISAFLLKLDYKNSIKICIRDRKNHLSPNCAYPESLVAGMLGIQLGGSHYYNNVLVVKNTIGDDIRKPNENDILHTINVLRISTLLSVILTVLIKFLY